MNKQSDTIIELTKKWRLFAYLNISKPAFKFKFSLSAFKDVFENNAIEFEFEFIFVSLQLGLLNEEGDIVR